MADKFWIFCGDLILILAIAIIHFVFYFFIKETDFINIFDIFSSSPLFDFELNDNCGAKDKVIFHRWEGIKETSYYRSNGHSRTKTEVVDATDIIIINGNKFCYNKKMTYLDLFK